MISQNVPHVPGAYTELVGGFNPSEKYYSKGESSPSRGKSKAYSI